MNADRFDAIARALIVATTRRRTLGALLGGALGLLGRALADDSMAKSRKCKPKCGPCERCKKGDCDKKNGRKRCKRGKCEPKANGTACAGGTCKGGRCIAPVPFCAGKNSCGGELVFCNRNGSPDACLCWVTVGGQPFCGGAAAQKPCAECIGAQACVDLTGCGAATGCAEPCAEPR